MQCQHHKRIQLKAHLELLLSYSSFHSSNYLTGASLEMKNSISHEIVVDLIDIAFINAVKASCNSLDVQQRELKNLNTRSSDNEDK